MRNDDNRNGKGQSGKRLVVKLTDKNLTITFQMRIGVSACHKVDDGFPVS